MPELDSGSFHTVTDPKQAQLLTEPISKEYFKPFLAHERSASEAAAMLQCSLNTMLYRIKTLLQVGLLQIARELPRKGRAVKIYRSVHDAYFVPFHVTPYATLEDRLEVQAEPIFGGLIRAYAAALRQDERYGHYIFVGEGGGVWTSDRLAELNPQGQPVVFSDMSVRLRLEDALTLGRELYDLFEKVRRSGVREADEAEAYNYFHLVAFLPLGEGYRS